jgi:ribosomal-protein-alanine N-acetyltransferase
MNSSVVLEAPSLARGDEFLTAVRHSRTLHHPWVQPPATREEFARFVGRAQELHRRSYLVGRRDDGSLVGVVTVSEIVRGPLQSAYLGYYGFAPWQGQGLMTAGLALVLREAFRTLKLHRVEANIQPGNAASLALVRRLGFQREGFSPRYLKIAGRWRDHERWALTVEDWRRRRTPTTT